ncbi:MAG: efflux RND transporter periplasmic adaptor subunit [Treponema sp.]|jgi:HlyD family secretion protein|nr:efflux RND transporter periplasmic adaptor subunit [Treponema sp.]
MKKQVFADNSVLVCLILTAIATAACSGKKSQTASYEFTNVRRGTLERTISASGTINPVSTVKVLPQMSGKVEKIYVDYNDSVRKGDILAELNTDMLKLKREQQYAAVVKARANYELQLLNYQSQEALAKKNLISEYELKTSKTALDNQAADLTVAQANLRSIDTEINQFAYIKSPINGIVLDRRINIGDTVVDSSSNNSSHIFTLAENLREMQIEAMVGELDITAVQKGQTVRFTLESLPGRIFNGVVETIRMVPVVSNNVVSYTVIVKVENVRGSLLAGMTCAIDFIVENSEDVLMVPNAALRYQPSSLNAEVIADMVFNASLENMNDEQRQAALTAREQIRAQNVSQTTNTGTGLTDLMMGSGPGMIGGRQFNPGGRQGQGQSRSAAPAVVMRNLWYINDEGKLDVMQVRIGISSGSFTEIRAADNFEGKQVILREKV